MLIFLPSKAVSSGLVKKPLNYFVVTTVCNGILTIQSSRNALLLCLYIGTVIYVCLCACVSMYLKLLYRVLCGL